MKVFFSTRDKRGILETDVLGVDIMGISHIVRIRENGILVLNSKTKEVVFNETLDLVTEKRKTLWIFSLLLVSFYY